jgi:hypothetical protein
MHDLDLQGQHLLVYLVSKLPNVVPSNPAAFIGYKDVHNELGLQQLRQTYGQSLQAQGLDSLSEWLARNALPAITGIVIDQGKWMPGPGFFRLFQKSEEDFQWWQAEVARSKAFDWSAYIPNAMPANAPPAIDLAPPGRQETTIHRIIRDTPVARRVKQLHEFKCQLCNHTIVLPDGSGYAEAHHIRPLGQPHNGPDIIDNIICLCPNHHAELDYGVRTLDKAEIRSARGHAIAEEYIRYHNEQVCGRT